MESVLLGLLGSSPAAVAVIFTVSQFLKYLREERTSWREMVTTALDNNTNAMTAQVLAMSAQAEAMSAQAKAIRELNAAVAKLERDDDKPEAK